MDWENPYSWSERMLHRLAFGSMDGQKLLSGLEDRLFKSILTDVPIDRPVFISSLPRSGTTLLLDIVASSGKFASHTYRDMPFVLSPMFWNQVTRPFWRHQHDRERAHGDGMKVSFDSPEAFEEILWTDSWNEKYRSDRIEPWTAKDQNEEFEGFFSSHLRKIVTLRGQSVTDESHLRYVSKNNANIARLPILKRMFPDAVIIVPFRSPQNYAGSVLRQHSHFTKMHEKDTFSLRYMEWLGHFEFGAALKPINFNDWLERNSHLGPFDAGFWLRYWAETYRFLLSLDISGLFFLDYDDMCSRPEPALSLLADAIGVNRDAMLKQAGRFHAPMQYSLNIEQVGHERLGQELADLHTQLTSRTQLSPVH